MHRVKKKTPTCAFKYIAISLASHLLKYGNVHTDRIVFVESILRAELRKAHIVLAFSMRFPIYFFPFMFNFNLIIPFIVYFNELSHYKWNNELLKSNIETHFTHFCSSGVLFHPHESFIGFFFVTCTYCKYYLLKIHIFLHIFSIGSIK